MLAALRRVVFTAASPLDSVPPAVLYAVVLVGVLAGGVVVWRLVGRARATPGHKFRRALADREAISVLMHPNPDPDAMSCAIAVAELASAVDTDATLQYTGEIRHQENRAFETVLDAHFEQIDGVSDLVTGAVVLVDHNEPRGFAGAQGIDPYAVVDHHPGDGTGRAFTDVRPDHGSCASILAEYFESLGWDSLPPADFENHDGQATALAPDVSTGLLYGIQSDTDHLTKGCSRAEFEAAAFLYEGVDQERLDRIANPSVDAEVLEVKARAITNREVRNAFAVSSVGPVSNVDSIPQAADELLRLEGVTVVVVMGNRDGTLHLSGRSRDDRVHMGKTLQSAVENIPMAEAGGHARMGGGQLSIDHMEGIGPSQGVSQAQFKERLFDAMTGTRQ